MKTRSWKACLLQFYRNESYVHTELTEPSDFERHEREREGGRKWVNYFLFHE